MTALDLLRLISDTKLLASDAVDAYRRRLEAGEITPEVAALAHEIVHDGALTAYPAQHRSPTGAATLLLDDYVIADKLGAGGMGQVFKAQHRRMDRIVAIKVLPKPR